MKELDEIRTNHKRSIARRAAKLEAQAAEAKKGTNGSNCTPSPLIEHDLSAILRK